MTQNVNSAGSIVYAYWAANGWYYPATIDKINPVEKTYEVSYLDTDRATVSFTKVFAVENVIVPGACVVIQADNIYDQAFIETVTGTGKDIKCVVRRPKGSKRSIT